MKVLVINFNGAIGDFILATPVYAALKNADPSSSIDALVRPLYRELLLHNPHINRVIVLKKNERGLMWRLLKEIRRVKYDFVINLDDADRATLIAWLSGARRFAGYTARLPAFLSPRTWNNDPLPSGEKPRHKAREYLEILENVGIPAPWTGLEVYADRLTRDKADRFWQESGLAHHRVAGFHIGASGPGKCWPGDRFADLRGELRRKGYKVAIFGGAKEIPAAARLTEIADSELVNLAGKLSLLESTVLIGKCDVFITGDSGPMHMAASQKVPTVALFGPTDPLRYKPYRVRHVVLRSNLPCVHDCRPDVRGCDPVSAACMAAIGTEEVLAAVERLVNGGG